MTVQVTHVRNITGERALLWDVTGTCNLRCKHCYQYDRYDYDHAGAYKNDLTHDQAVEALSKAISSGITHVHFLGGEPLLRRDLPELIEQARASGVTVSINTNGLPLTRRKLTELVGLGTEWIMVSLDGASPSTNDPIRGLRVFDRVVRNIRAAVELCGDAKTRLGIVFTATNSNCADLTSMFELAIDLRIDQLRIIPVDEAGNYVNNATHLGADVPRLVDELDRALDKYAYQMIGKLPVVIDLPLWPIEVLNRRHGNVLTPDAAALGCSGGRSFVVLQADGAIGPCSAALDETYSAGVRSSGHLTKEKVFIGNPKLRSIDDAQSLRAFYTYQADPQTFAHLQPCNRCRFIEQCRPCPIEHDTNKTVEACIWAENAESDDRLHLAHSKVEPTPEWELSGEYLVKRGNGKRRIRLGLSLAEMISGSIATNYPLSELALTVFTEPLRPEQFNQVLDNIILLAANGLLRVVPTPKTL